MSSEIVGPILDFPTDESALQYLRDRIPPASEYQSVDLNPFQVPLFNHPQGLSPGDHEFNGSDVRVSFGLVDSASSYDRCYLDLSNDSGIEGQWNPIHGVVGLTVKSSNFSYSLRYPDSQRHAPVNSIFWLPGLKSPDTELSRDYVNAPRGNIYLLDGDGFLARPIDLLGFFHEVGHIETYADLPKGPDTMTHDAFNRPRPTNVRTAAHELQREEAANAWVMQNVTPLFKDIGIPAEDVEALYRNVQLRSYHDAANRMFLDDIAA